MNNSVSQELLKFLQKSPTAFHAVATDEIQSFSQLILLN